MLITLDSVIVSAFMFGIVSALSLPLGSITSIIWKPDDRAIAFLMAFGGGALLAALTLDLVAGTVAQGHFYSLAAGCIVGGVTFIVLNNIINDFGGFLRKASTTVHHLRKQQYRKFKQILSSLRRVDIFQHLSVEEYKVLADALHGRPLKKGAILFNKGDSADELYIIARGRMSLQDPLGLVAPKLLTEHDDLGWLAFLTGVPYRYTARALEDVDLWVLPKASYFSLLKKSPVLTKEIQRWLRNPIVTDYLTQQHSLSIDTVKLWQDQTIHSLLKHGVFSPALNINHHSDKFRKTIDQFIGCELFKSLPNKEVEALSDRLIYKKIKQGEIVYFQGESATNMYIINQGHVSVLDGDENCKHAYDLKNLYSFGYLSFLTGGNYTMTTMAVEETDVWVLHKRDFNNLVLVLPELSKQYSRFLQSQQVADYLIERQKISQNDALKWIKKSTQQVINKKTVQPVNTVHFDISEHKGAPLGIWLGLLLDSIPEALVIGSSVAQSGLGFSLLAGLFFSNYPEALSSSVGMREQGMKMSAIIIMWTILMLSTGLVSALGSIYFAEVSHSTFAFTEGVAAGAMLTMIAQTMLPEAYLKGGEIVGISSLFGFLAAIFFKTLE